MLIDGAVRHAGDGGLPGASKALIPESHEFARRYTFRALVPSHHTGLLREAMLKALGVLIQMNKTREKWT